MRRRNAAIIALLLVALWRPRPEGGVTVALAPPVCEVPLPDPPRLAQPSDVAVRSGATSSTYGRWVPPPPELRGRWIHCEIDPDVALRRPAASVYVTRRGQSAPDVRPERDPESHRVLVLPPEPVPLSDIPVQRPWRKVETWWRQDALAIRVDDDEPGARALVRLDGYTQVMASIVGDRCVIDAVTEAPVIFGRVITTEGIADDRIVVEGCGGSARTDRDGGFFLQAEPGPCVLRARRTDGLLVLSSAPAEVDPAAGAEVLLDLTLPPYRAAGVGVSLEREGGDILIRRVFEGTPADAAGVEEGDRIIALDGEDVSGWSIDEFLDVSIGAPGTEIVYQLERDGQVVDVPMTRVELE